MLIHTGDVKALHGEYMRWKKKNRKRVRSSSKSEGIISLHNTIFSVHTIVMNMHTCIIIKIYYDYRRWQEKEKMR